MSTQSNLVPIDTFISDTAKQGRKEVEAFSQHLKNLPEKRWFNQSFCSDWTIKDVVEHQVEQGVTFFKLTDLFLKDKDANPNQNIFEQAKNVTLGLNRLELADKLVQVTNDFYDLIEKATPEQLLHTVPTPYAKFPLSAIASVRLGELSLHSWDVRVVDNLTAKVNRESLPLLFPGLVSFLPILANREVAKQMDSTTIQFEISGTIKKPIALILTNGKLQTVEHFADNPDTTIKLDADAFLRMAWGRLRMDWMIRDGWIKVEGNKDNALKLNELFKGL